MALIGAELLVRTRRLAEDLAEPYYILDEEMYSYITDAERELAVAGRLLRDVHEYSVVKDDKWIAIGTSPEVLEIRKAELVDSNGTRYKLNLKGTLDTMDSSSVDEDYGYVSEVAQTTKSRPRTLIFGERTGYFKLHPTSNASYTIEAFRTLYPTAAIDGDDDTPSVAERHHAALPIGAALRALQAAETEFFLPDRIQHLEIAWNRALFRAAEETSQISRDTPIVTFSNDLW